MFYIKKIFHFIKMKLKNIIQHSVFISLNFLLITTILNLVYYVVEKEKLYLYSFLTTLIASLFYLYFYYKKSISSRLRYMDWIITTPILLLELCILSKIKNSKLIITILCVNFLTFAFGWLGEVKFLSRWKSCILAFVPFLFTFYLIIKNGDWNNFILFFIIIWTLYGLVFLFPRKEYRNLSYNILDCISKGVFSLLLL